MKKILYILFVICLVGCTTKKEIKEVKTKVTSNEQIAFIEQQDEIIEIKKEEVSKPSPSLPIVGNNNLIVIDAGHQRYGDSSKEPIGPGATQTKAKVTDGAVGVSTGSLESQINLEVAFKLQSKLEASGYQVIMVRTSQDVNISNSQRASIANDNKAGAFIRIHCNSYSSSNAVGTLTVAPSTSNPYCSNIASASQRLSKSVLNNICNQTGSKNRGVLIDDSMSGINWCQVPVTIVEMGFLSNPSEDKLLSDSSYQDKIADGIVLGINEYMK